MKRQRSSSHVDDLDDDRRRFYDRGPAPPPPRSLAKYESDGFDRRSKGFGGGFYDNHRYRDSPSPSAYGGDRSMRRSESFSAPRREFHKDNKGFRSQRDRSRRDGGGSSSSWRRPGDSWRDSDGFGAHRSVARQQALSPPRRSPTESSRRFDGAKVDKLRKQNCGVGEIEEGEVAPDPEAKTRRSAAEHRKQVESGHPKGKRTERGESKKVDSSGLRLRVVLRTQGKGATGASAADNLGKEEGESMDGVLAEAGEVTNIRLEKSASDVEEKVGGGDESASAVDQVRQSTKSSMSREGLHDEVDTRANTANAADVVGQSTPFSIVKESTQEEVTTQDETAIALDEVGQGTSCSIQKEGLQEAAMALDETANAVDVVLKGSSSSMLHEVHLEEAGDGNANVGDGVGTCTSILQGVMQEEVIILDVAANIVDSQEEVSYSGMLKEGIHEEDMVIDGNGTADAINVVGQSNSSSMLEEATHGTVTTQERTDDALDTDGKSRSSTMLQIEVQGEVMTSLCQEVLEIKEAETESMTDRKIGETTESVAPQPVEEALEKYGCENSIELDKAKVVEEEAAAEHEVVANQVKHVDLEPSLEAKLVGSSVFLQPPEDHTGDCNQEGAALNLIMEKPMAEDKRKGIAFDVLSKAGGDNLVGRSLDLGLQPDIDQKELSKSTRTISVKEEADTHEIRRLDLSLSLSGGLQNPEFKCSVSRPDSLAHGPCSQSLPSSSSFRTNSDGIATLVSLDNSRTFVHNPSYSLTQQPLDDCDHSISSKPFYQGVYKVSDSKGWRLQSSSNRSTQKGDGTPLLQRVSQNGYLSYNTLVGVNAQNNGTSGVLSPAHNRGSHNAGLEDGRHGSQFTREKLVLNGSGVVERVISKIVSEPLNQTGRMLQEMTDNSRTYLREAISEIIVDADERGQIVALQEALKKRSDLNSEILRRCPRVLLEILVAIRTGLPDFIKKSSTITTFDLVDIFLNLKCHNFSCQRVLPAFDCDCKICQQKTGFCSSCMCVICMKFDTASNTCSWVGCDVCLHWCHTDCGLRHSLIREGESGSRAYGTSEMQFHCTACGHPSEMYGFVKEVFRTCAKQWGMETLIRELQYVKRIFSASDDARGKRVRGFVKQMLIKLEKKAYYSEIVKYVIAFFSEDNPSLGSGPAVPLKGIPCSIAEGVDGIPSSSRKATWLPSVTLEGVPFQEKAGILSATGRSSMPIKFGETEFQAVNNKPVIDELDGLVKLKQAEANMYQEHANDARKEAESLKHITMVKYAQIEEHYATQMGTLHINELQKSRKQMVEELQVIERSHHQFLSMKTRMQANIRELLLKMEATKQNLST
ncbi:protein OBERON 4 [Brachypodium distachyon]|uniref:Uncharacterized protein n=1 Tax=Brachypodium distachyon TaxID=15368 RepID=A0A0Q3HJJ3_BRADI|nr:protein OBERON 4 [Brachypodium distachyon]XP_010228963.2 protein OBERON 4 [Brachypodium distachyon]XP_024313774.1 protein OBERON 4 [Brachypodium distachyon]KQK22859.1 hypothetical protein BRADI_1g69720v3 [Brachypodium distachyon]KQK22861.1 hypothetical protein BRADI_1g69720v3 [Brachypodium distachyon]KQK22862.1 hypothetical protein BRADI_1g69720v3 [Brachypodium distachyon]KQK22863.1 hypothetical protein BRADI_1g69720v3 [Brachypodium distachyon]|eukprot:XP_003558483.2 protein OBERON 4 [Brachypodium distachyon]